VGALIAFALETRAEVVFAGPGAEHVLSRDKYRSAELARARRRAARAPQRSEAGSPLARDDAVLTRGPRLYYL
jgi:hypothetical protein